MNGSTAMAGYVVKFEEIDETQVALVGGKGAHLGALSRIGGIHVPPGFCVTTEAFQRVVGELDRPNAAELREAVEAIVIPDDVAKAIIQALDEEVAYAVRSSATVEDSPGASFAGQHDSYLNIVGPAAVLQHVSRCWASLFSERAVAYRLRNGFVHRDVRMAVVVQRMVPAQASGVLFTADPMTGNRKVASVEAIAGLGEALVSGLVTPAGYTVRDGQIEARTGEPLLTDEQVIRLVRLGRRIEAHFGRPQDIEWCLTGDDFQIVQSRPITTLFPIPVVDDEDNHVYLSVGHQQMMTDPMKPLGLSFWQMTTPAPMAEAGGRLFVDVTQRLASSASRDGLMDAVGRSDPLTGDALRTILERDGFIRPLPDEGPPGPLFGDARAPIETDPAVVTELIGHSQASIATLAREIRTKSGVALLDFIQADMQELRRILFDPRSHQVFMSAMEAAWWLNDHLLEWLGEKNAADTLTQSVPHNVTSEMGLALLDVADAIRPHPEVVAFLQQVEDGDVLDQLAGLAGGREARDAIEAWLDEYGMRCVGEIDITRPRWRERPSTLVPVILGNVKNFEPG